MREPASQRYGEGEITMVFKRDGSNNWSFKFTWKGQLVRESTGQSNQRIARQMESAKRTQLAKGEVGLKDKQPVPTLAAFATSQFLPFVRSHNAAKPRTVVFYEGSVKHLLAFPKLAKAPLNEIDSKLIASYIADRQKAKPEISTTNRELATLRRIFKLAQEWRAVTTLLPVVRLSPGENRRTRVITPDEELAYLTAATQIGHDSQQAYAKALVGIRAVERGQVPRKPDSYLLRDVMCVLLDAGLRPEELARLKWKANVRDGAIEIHTGKGKGSRRRVPMSSRILAILEMRRADAVSNDYVFPASTKSGHLETSGLKKQHRAAIKASGVEPFVLYDARHTAITRWSKVLGTHELQALAGHRSIVTTSRYVHLDEDGIRVALAKVAHGGPSTGPTPEKAGFETLTEFPLIQ